MFILTVLFIYSNKFFHCGRLGCITLLFIAFCHCNTNATQKELEGRKVYFASQFQVIQCMMKGKACGKYLSLLQSVEAHGRCPATTGNQQTGESRILTPSIFLFFSHFIPSRAPDRSMYHSLPYSVGLLS